MLKVIGWTSSAWLPIAVASLMAMGVVISYIWAVVRKDVEAFLPFISDAGGSPPQSGIFAIFLFLSSVAGLLTVFLRYYSIKSLSTFSRASRFINLVSLFLGLICICGIMVVASYPVNSVPKPGNHNWQKDVLVPHTIGAFMIFTIGVIYALSQSVCTFLLRKSVHLTSRPLCLFICRGCLVLAAFIAFIVMIVGPRINKDDDAGAGNYTSTESPLTTTTESSIGWQSDDSKIVAIVSEWVLAFSLFLFFATMFVEMRDIGVEIRIERRNELSLLGSGSISTIDTSSVAT